MTTLSTRVAALLLTAPLLLLAACGSDDSTDAGPTGIPPLQGDSCQADVTLSGSVTASWTDAATVSTSDSDVAPPASYQTRDGDDVLTLLSTGHGFDAPSVLLQVGADSYGVAAGTGSVDVRADGSGATVDAPAAQVGGDGKVQVTVTITC